QVRLGEISAFVRFISSGFCNIYREVKVLVELPLGKRVSSITKVALGQLNGVVSFGEAGVLQILSTCTTVTATAVKMRTIDANDMLSMQ
ncbi:unnamed protein product, partial [Bubo scandiacus]